LNESELEDVKDLLWAVTESTKASVESMDEDGVTVDGDTDASNAMKELLECQAKVIMIYPACGSNLNVNKKDAMMKVVYRISCYSFRNNI
jgi:hypothetical protein